MILVILLVSFLLIALFYASYSIGAGIYIKSFCGNSGAGRVVSFTFDDGVEPGQTEKVLDVLKKYNVKGLFFVIGHKAEKYPDIVKRIADEGHLIGNHSYSHTPFFSFKSTQSVVDELEHTNAIIREITGIEKVEYFRPPYGVTNPNIARAVKRVGITSIGWNIRSFDTNMRVRRDKVSQRVLSKLKDGSVILLHDILPESDILLEQIICGVKELNYTIEPLNILKSK